MTYEICNIGNQSSLRSKAHQLPHATKITQFTRPNQANFLSTKLHNPLAVIQDEEHSFISNERIKLDNFSFTYTQTFEMAGTMMSPPFSVALMADWAAMNNDDARVEAEENRISTQILEDLLLSDMELDFGDIDYEAIERDAIDFTRQDLCLTTTTGVINPPTSRILDSSYYDSSEDEIDADNVVGKPTISPPSPDLVLSDIDFPKLISECITITDSCSRVNTDPQDHTARAPVAAPVSPPPPPPPPPTAPPPPSKEVILPFFSPSVPPKKKKKQRTSLFPDGPPTLPKTAGKKRKHDVSTTPSPIQKKKKRSKKISGSSIPPLITKTTSSPLNDSKKCDKNPHRKFQGFKRPKQTSGVKIRKTGKDSIPRLSIKSFNEVYHTEFRTRVLNKLKKIEDERIDFRQFVSDKLSKILRLLSEK